MLCSGEFDAACLLHVVCCIVRAGHEISQADGDTLNARLTAVVTQGAKGAPAGPAVCTQTITASEAPNGASPPPWRPQASMSSQRACLATLFASEDLHNSPPANAGLMNRE